jgi:hypothetical protein
LTSSSTGVKCHFGVYGGDEYFTVANEKANIELPKLLDCIHRFMEEIDLLQMDSFELVRFVAKYISCEARTIKELRHTRVVKLAPARKTTRGQLIFAGEVTGGYQESEDGQEIRRWSGKSSTTKRS